MSRLIDVSGLRYTVGSFRLDVPRFEVRAGELHVLLGPTGSGKTLLLEYIAGLLPKAAGAISIDGRSADRLAPERRHVSYVPQDLALFPNLSVEENIAFSLRFRESAGSAMLRNLIGITGIESLLERQPATLSGGEKQRVALVRALAAQPRALLLDEPFSALHPSLRLSLWELLKRLHEELDLSILLVSHDVEEALALGEVISYIDDGAVLQTSRRKEVYYHPRSLSVARFFGFRNLFRADVASVDEGSIFLSDPVFGSLEVAATHRESDLRAGDRVWWGVHAEEITVVRPERIHVPRSNFFSGMVVSQVDIGRSRLARLELDRASSGSRAELELALPEHAARRLKIAEGHLVHVQLKPDRLFIIRDAADSRDAE